MAPSNKRKITSPPPTSSDEPPKVKHVKRYSIPSQLGPNPDEKTLTPFAATAFDASAKHITRQDTKMEGLTYDSLHAASDPPEDTQNDLQATVPVFSSFGAKDMKASKQKTQPPKRSATQLRTSFVVGKLKVKAPENRPSLAAQDKHKVRPILPVAAPLSSKIKLQIGGFKVASAQGAPASRTARSKPSSKQSTPINPAVNTSFYKQLPTIKEDSVLGKKRKEPKISGVEQSDQSSAILNTSFSSKASKIPGGWQSSQSNELLTTSFSGKVAKLPGAWSPSMSFSGSGPRTIQDEEIPDTDVENNDIAKLADSKTAKPERDGYGFDYEDFSDDSDFESEGEPIIKPDSSFKDALVMRDKDSFSSHRQTRRLPCTHATNKDTALMKLRAKRLLKYDVSDDIMNRLNNRVERMMTTEIENRGNKLRPGEEPPSVLQSAIKLRTWLQSIRAKRVEMGESEDYIKHEMECMYWVVDAAQCGVLHLKVPTCTCRPGWDEESDLEVD